MSDSFDIIIIGGGAPDACWPPAFRAIGHARAAARGRPRYAAGQRTWRRARYLRHLLLQRRLFLAWPEGALAPQENSPLVGFSQGRIMGGGSSVMGMVAYRGTPDDYAEWEAHGAAGWGGTTCCRIIASSRTTWISAAKCMAAADRCRSRRTSPDDWAPLSKAVHAFAQERQIPFIADMNADFRDVMARCR
jgi:5-(hydroxymethyl)furfural/furfural oxidase